MYKSFNLSVGIKFFKFKILSARGVFQYKFSFWIVVIGYKQILTFHSSLITLYILITALVPDYITETHFSQLTNFIKNRLGSHFLQLFRAH